MFLADVGDDFSRALREVVLFLPELAIALVILIVGYFLAKLIGGAVWRALNRAGLDRALAGGPGGPTIERVTGSPSQLIGKIAFWAVFLAALSLAISVLGINALTEFVAAVYAYLPNVLAALLIFLVAGAIATAVVALVSRTMGDTGLGKIVGTVAPVLVMAIATFMILEQLKIAHDIVVTTYTLLLGAVALGSALAFGLGGRDVAREMLEGAYQKGQENKEQFKEDLNTGKERARQQKEEMTGGGGDTGGGSGTTQTITPSMPQTQSTTPESQSTPPPR